MNKDVIWIIFVIEVAVVAILTMLYFSATWALMDQKAAGLVLSDLNITNNDTDSVGDQKITEDAGIQPVCLDGNSLECDSILLYGS